MAIWIYLQIWNVFKHERIVDTDLFAYFFVHGINVSLIDGHALFGQRRCVIDRYFVQFRMRRPIFVYILINQNS